MKNQLFSFIVSCVLLTSATMCFADSTRPDDHAPINVMGDHMHNKGEWMIGYRYKTMYMQDLYLNNDKIREQQVLADFMMVPQEMDMTMHMLGVMYAPSDSVTLTAMLPFMEKEMQGINRMGQSTESNSSGIGDIKVNSLILLEESGSTHTHAHLGISIPTGSIDKSKNGMRLPYGMQAGSGTWDFNTGITHKRFFEHSSFGIQALATLRTGENDNNYRLGNKYQLNTWYAYNLNHHWALSIGVDYIKNDDIKGADPMLNPMMSPNSRAELAASKRSNTHLGVNYLDASGHRFAITLAKEIYRDFDAPRLAQDWSFNFGWQYAFK
ncbi:MAG: transporter [Kangiellaceae bacterium]|nr:transporter [Kangiellaceae bacterium]